MNSGGELVILRGGTGKHILNVPQLANRLGIPVGFKYVTLLAVSAGSRVGQFSGGRCIAILRHERYGNVDF